MNIGSFVMYNGICYQIADVEICGSKKYLTLSAKDGEEFVLLSSHVDAI